MVLLTVIANDVSKVCPSRSPFQMSCSKLHCHTCAPGYINCTGLLKMHVAGGVAYEIIRQMATDRRFHILTEENGVYYYSDIDWKTFHRDDNKTGKMLLLRKGFQNDAHSYF